MSVLRVEVVVALPDRQEVIALELPQGASVATALEVARVRERFPELDWSGVTCGLWSRPCAVDRPLRDGDRVEVYRPLAADPKDQPRERARLKPSTRSRSARGPSRRPS